MSVTPSSVVVVSTVGLVLLLGLVTATTLVSTLDTEAEWDTTISSSSSSCSDSMTELGVVLVACESMAVSSVVVVTSSSLQHLCDGVRAQLMILQTGALPARKTGRSRRGLEDRNHQILVRRDGPYLREGRGRAVVGRVARVGRERRSRLLLVGRRVRREEEAEVTDSWLGVGRGRGVLCSEGREWTVLRGDWAAGR